MISYTYKDIENRLAKQRPRNYNVALISTFRLAADYLSHPYVADFHCGSGFTKQSKFGIWILNQSDELLWRELTRVAARLGASCFIFLGRILPKRQNSQKSVYVLKDHINVSGKNPLIGPNDDDLGTRFPDMSNLYDDMLMEAAIDCMVKFGEHPRIATGLVPQSNLQTTELEDDILSLRDDLIISSDVYAGAITARHLGGRSIGLLVGNQVPTEKINTLVLEIVDKISQA